MREVHFIHLGGEFVWQHWRAVETAKVHGAQRVLWCAGDIVGEGFQDLGDIETRPLDLPDWLRDHPIALANVKDLYAWRILHEHGGIYLDLDTISLRPAWDLLDRGVCVSTEYEAPDMGEHYYNSAVVLAEPGAPVLEELAARAEKLLEAGASRWGTCGPHLLTDVVAERPDAFDAAPFGVLNGWRDGTIREYYAGARPGPDVRVAHLFSSSNLGAFHADRWMP